MAEKEKFLVLLKPRDSKQPAIARAAQYSKLQPDIEVTACRIVNNFTEESKDQITVEEIAYFETMKRNYPAISNFKFKLIFNKNIAETFVEEARDGGYDLAIISANKRNTIKDLFISTIDSTIMRRTYVPLLVVKDANSSSTLGTAILIALDLSESDHLRELDEYLVKSARMFADKFNGEIHLVNCVSPLNRGLMSGDTGGSKILSGTTINRTGIHFKIAMEFADEYGIPQDRVHVVEGRIDEEIPRLSEILNARMVCMGTTPRSTFFGSIDSIASELVLEQIAGDVFIVSSEHLKTE